MRIPPAPGLYPASGRAVRFLFLFLAANLLGEAVQRAAGALPNWAWNYPDGALAENPQSAPASHSMVYQSNGAYAAWPANFGMWSWGSEMVAGFFLGKFLYTASDHNVDTNVPLQIFTARSLDGGAHWQPPVPFAPQPAAACPLDDIDFTTPSFALKIESDYGTDGFSQFYISLDRAQSWYGPYLFPKFGFRFIDGRTDYLVRGPKELIAFLSGADMTLNRQGEGGVFAIRTLDGGKTWSFPAWVTPPAPPGDASFYIMPSSLALTNGRILTAVRHYDANVPAEMNGFIDLFASDDQGATWQPLSRAASQLGGPGNPPSLVPLQGGRLAVIYGRRVIPYGIRARISADNGQSWGKEIVLRKDGYYFDIGYTRAAVRPDGNVTAVYYLNTAPAESAPSNSFVAATVWQPGTGQIDAPSNLTAQISGTGVALSWRDTSSGQRGFKIERLADFGTPTVSLKAYNGIFQPPTLDPAGSANAFVQGAFMGTQRWLYVPPELSGLPRLETAAMDWYLNPLPNKYVVTLSGPGTIYLPLEYQYYGAPLPWMDNSWTDTGLMADSFETIYGNYVLGWSLWKKEIPTGGDVALGSAYSQHPGGWNAVNYVFSGKIGWSTLAATAPGVTQYTDLANLAAGVCYSYRVRATGDTAGDSDASNVATLTYLPTNTQSNQSLALGQLARLTFDETNGSSFADASSNGNSATLVAGYYTASPTPNHIAGIVGSGAVYLNGLGNYGTGDYLALGSASQLDVGAGSFTLTAWLKTAAMNDVVILNKYSNAGLESGYLLSVDGASNQGKLRLRFCDGANNPLSKGAKEFKGSQSVNDGAWHHIAIIADRTNRVTRFYVDGVLSSQTAGDNSGNISTPAVFSPGKANGAYGGYLTGALDDMRVYNRVLSDVEISGLAALGGRNISQPATLLSNICVSNITLSGATVGWSTELPADSQVDYGPTTNYGSASPFNSALVTNHSVSLTGLAANTTYHYRVRSSAQSGAQSVSSDNAFTTTAYFTIALIQNGSGTISVSPNGMPSFPANSTVTLTAASAGSAVFTGWSGGASGAANPATITVTSNLWVMASFSDALTNIVIDSTDPRATATGSWPTGGYCGTYGPDYQFASCANPASAVMIYRPQITVPGLYDVALWYGWAANASSNAPWSVVSAGKTLTTNIDQRAGWAGWREIASAVRFDAGTNGYVSLSNGAGESSNRIVIADAVRFTPSRAPAIVLDPQDQSAGAGAPVTFWVQASGTTPLSYQWQFNHTNLPDAIGASLTLPQVRIANAGNYAVQISNRFGSASSSSAALTVLPPARPRFSAVSVDTNLQAHLALSADSGVGFLIQTSTDLSSWTLLTNFVTIDGTAQLTLPADKASPLRFYRAQWLVQ